MEGGRRQEACCGGQAMDERLLHDSAWMTAQSIMESLDGVFRDDEKRDAFAKKSQCIHIAKEYTDSHLK